MDEILDTEAVAAFIGLPAKTLEQWRYLNKGPAYVKAGKHVRYRRADVEAWLDAQTVTPGNVA